MAQVRLQHIGSSLSDTAGAFDTAEVVEVPLGSWLPEQFVVGSTFYSEKDQKQGKKSKEVRGLPSRSSSTSS